MSSENKHSHYGHRKRKKTQFLKNGGAESFSDLDILEMLLYYAVPRTDTVPIAKALLEEFGSLQGVLNADKGEVSKVSGLKESAEVLFGLLKEVSIRTSVERPEPSLLEHSLLKKHLIELFRDAENETVFALYFSDEGALLGQQLIFKGAISSVKFSLRKVTEGVIRSGGSQVVIAHNHPSGSLAPSTEDILSTKRIAAHLAANEIELIEHYIVGNNDCVGILNLC